MRPQSVVGLGIENLSLSHIPDLLEYPNSHNDSKTNDKDDDANDGDSITELPSASFQLQHLVKGRPKRAKTRAPTRPLIPELQTRELGEGLEQFFQRPGSATPSTLTPLVSPTSEDCSSLSFVDSPTMSRDDTRNNLTSEETTPILEERKMVKGCHSPTLKNQWTSRSISSDNLEKYSPLAERKSPLIKMKVDRQEKNDINLTEENSDHQSPSEESTMTNSISCKNRPWSVVGQESKSLDYLGSEPQRQDSIEKGNLKFLMLMNYKIKKRKYLHSQN